MHSMCAVILDSAYVWLCVGLLWLLLLCRFIVMWFGIVGYAMRLAAVCCFPYLLDCSLFWFLVVAGHVLPPLCNTPKSYP